MVKLIYSAITSLDGYIADEQGNFDWAAPDEELHTFVNDLERPVGTYLYGRRMYETMLYWETAHTLPDQSAVAQDFTAIWQAADKIVYSRTVATVSSARTRIERDFDPEAVRQMKATAGRDITVGGPDLAAQAIKAGLVDELQLFLTPIVVGDGNSPPRWRRESREHRSWLARGRLVWARVRSAGRRCRWGSSTTWRSTSCRSSSAGGSRTSGRSLPATWAFRTILCIPRVSWSKTQWRARPL
jgi:dihydrofolate reductase